jgi:hypothetical protein
MRKRHRKERWLVYQRQKEIEDQAKRLEEKDVVKPKADDDFNNMFKKAVKLIKP